MTTFNRRRAVISATLGVLLFAPQLSQSLQAATARGEDAFTLAFVDADARHVVDAVLGSMMSVDYSVDPAITGNLTLRTAQPVPRSALLGVLEQALSSIDAVIVLQGKRYLIVPRAQARAVLPASVSSPTDRAETTNVSAGYASEIVTLKYASPAEMARLIEQFLGKDIVSSRNDALNQLVIAGTGEERKAARDIIKRFDIDSLAQMTFEMYPLANVDAGVLVGELKRVFAPPYDIIGSRVRLVPLPRLRSVLAIASDRADLARVEPWIRRLDTGSAGARRLYSYAVQNGRARDLAAALQQVLSGVQSNAAVLPGGGSGNRVEASVPSPKLATLAGGSVAGQGNSASTSQPASSSVAEDLPSSFSESGSSGVRIVPNEANNSLLIYANGEDYALIKDALTELDKPVPQVLIEATLAEVTLGNDLQYGIDFKTITGDATFTNVSNTGGTPAASFPGFSASLISGSTTAILNALQSKTNVRVLSAPRLFVLNNQTATLQVGDQVPIVTQQAQGVGAPGAPVVNTVQLRDTGVILQVTPRVNQSGVVTLDISQEVSDVAKTTTSGINSPTIQQRRLTSTVATRSGQVVALGGLIRERASKGRSGVPLLSQIPIIGAAFGSHSNGASRTELIILIKPTVIRSPDEVKGMVDGLIEGFDETESLIEKARASELPAVKPMGASPPTMMMPGPVPPRPK
jgi:general secretion pathway protein D